jgi:mono/diheme cytochrome c family protein
VGRRGRLVGGGGGCRRRDRRARLASSVSPSHILAGEKLYTRDCVSCHGDLGKGDGELAPLLSTLAREPLKLGALSSRETLDVQGRASVRRVISAGGEHTGHTRFMPAWGYQLTTQEVDDLTDYIMQLPGTPAGMDRSKLASWLRAAPGDATDGAMVYMHQCSACHGRDGRGDGPVAKRMHERSGVDTADLTSSTVVGTHTDRELYVIIASGGRSSAHSAQMPYWSGYLTPGRVKDVIEYIHRISDTTYKP